jgi:hypothetical protein
MPEVDENATHSEPVEEVQTAEDVLNMFGLGKEIPVETKKEAKEDATEPTPTPPTEAEKKGMTVKHLKEEKFVEEKDYPEYLRKGLDRDRLEAKNTALTQQMDEFAQLQGYKSHAELLADLPNIKKQKEQSQQTALDTQRDNLLTELEAAGYDREKAAQYIDNHPLFQEGKKAIEAQKESNKNNGVANQLKDLFDAYPDLERPEPDKPTPWYTPEMHAMAERGYTYKDAYTLLNLSTIQTKSVEDARQQAIKDIKLGKRAQVETNALPEAIDDGVPDDVAATFAAFGFGKDTAKKQLAIQKTKAR